MPMPTSDVRSCTDRPKISTTHSSPHRSCSSSSSKPDSHSAPIERGDSVIRQRISTCPDAGSHPSKRGCSSRTSWPSSKRCCPKTEPTGPDQLPDCTADTRSGGSWIGHTGWSTGTSRTRQESASRYDARVCARELQAGR